MNRNVTPWRCSSRIRSNSRLIAAPSSWAVGSSRMMKRAPNDSARAISTNCRCSTSRSPARVCGRRRRPTRSRSSPRASRAQRPPADQAARPRSCRLRNRFSATVSVGDDRRLLVDAGDPLAPGVAVGEGGAAAPSKRTSPASGACSPVRIDTSVDLPAPLRPTSACVDPRRPRCRGVQRHGRAVALGRAAFRRSRAAAESLRVLGCAVRSILLRRDARSKPAGVCICGRLRRFRESFGLPEADP